MPTASTATTEPLGPDVQVERGYTFCRRCRGVLSGQCDCMMHQHGIDTSGCVAHRGGSHVGGGCKCNPKPAPQRFRIKLSNGFAELMVPTRLSAIDLTIIRGIVDLIAIVPNLEDKRYVSAVEAACERGEVRDSTEVGDGPDP